MLKVYLEWQYSNNLKIITVSSIRVLFTRRGGGKGRPNPYRETKFSGPIRDRDKLAFPVQLNTGTIRGQLKPNLLKVMINSQQQRLLCIYGHHIKQEKDQPGKVASPARGQLNRENEYFPVLVRA